MSIKEILPTISNIITPFLEKQGIELVELKSVGVGKSAVLQVFVWTKSGINDKILVHLHRHIQDMIDEEGILNESYRLQVSSLGLDRPLVNSADFRRAVGEKVEITLIDGSNITGKIESTSKTEIFFDTSDGPREIDVADVVKGKIIIEF